MIKKYEFTSENIDLIEFWKKIVQTLRKRHDYYEYDLYFNQNNKQILFKKDNWDYNRESNRFTIQIEFSVIHTLCYRKIPKITGIENGRPIKNGYTYEPFYTISPLKEFEKYVFKDYWRFRKWIRRKIANLEYSKVTFEKNQTYKFYCNGNIELIKLQKYNHLKNFRNNYG